MTRKYGLVSSSNTADGCPFVLDIPVQWVVKSPEFRLKSSTFLPILWGNNDANASIQEVNTTQMPSTRRNNLRTGISFFSSFTHYWVIEHELYE